ncbi:MAG: amidohydrolase [Gammaproteobacteria bacterium]|nr:amidohydrolase [Gammaproteobacteria bacterium]
MYVYTKSLINNLFVNFFFKFSITFVAIFSFLLFLYITPSWANKLNDGHIHYNDDVWDDLSPDQVISYLTENEINRAIVFGTPTAGTEKLYKLSPQRVIPFLMPYRVFRDRHTWHSDPTMPDYVKQQLSTGIYKGFGEFHLFKEHKDTTVIRQLMQMVADHKIMLSAHADVETIEALIEMQPEVSVIWAHCGMDHPVEDVRRMLAQYPKLFCELSFRYNMFDKQGKLLTQWKTLLEEYSKRFILGMDTYIPRRWANLPENVDFARQWLSQLQPETRKLIGGGNIDRMFPLKK